MAGSLLFSGCLSKPALPRQTFALANPSPAAAPGAGVDVLAIRTCDIAATFAGRAFAYRIGPDQYELDPYAGFLATPAQAVGIPLREHLRNSGAFRDIVAADSPIAANAWLDVHIAELYGDFRNPAQPAAVLTLQFRFTTTDPGQRTKTLMQKDYTRSVPLKLPTATALVAGWDTALTEIMQAVATDLAAARAN